MSENKVDSSNVDLNKVDLNKVDLNKVAKNNLIEILEQIPQKHKQAVDVFKICDVLFKEEDYLKNHYPYLYLKFLQGVYIEHRKRAKYIGNFLLSNESDERKLEILKKYPLIIDPNYITIISDKYSNLVQKHILNNVIIGNVEQAIAILRQLKNLEDKLVVIKKLDYVQKKEAAFLDYLYKEEIPKLKTFKEKINLRLELSMVWPFEDVLMIIQHINEEEAISFKNTNSINHLGQVFHHKTIIDFYLDENKTLDSLSLNESKEIKTLLSSINFSDIYNKQCYEIALNLAIKMGDTKLFFDQMNKTNCYIIMQVCLERGDKKLVDQCLEKMIANKWLLDHDSKKTVENLIAFYKNDIKMLNKIFDKLNINHLLGLLMEKDDTYLSANIIEAFITELFILHQKSTLETFSIFTRKEPNNYFVKQVEKSIANSVLGACKTDKEVLAKVNEFTSAWTKEDKNPITNIFTGVAKKFNVSFNDDRKKKKLELLEMLESKTPAINAAIKSLGGLASSKSKTIETPKPECSNNNNLDDDFVFVNIPEEKDKVKAKENTNTKENDPMKVADTFSNDGAGAGSESYTNSQSNVNAYGANGYNPVTNTQSSPQQNLPPREFASSYQYSYQSPYDASGYNAPVIANNAPALPDQQLQQNVNNNSASDQEKAPSTADLLKMLDKVKAPTLNPTSKVGQQTTNEEAKQKKEENQALPS